MVIRFALLAAFVFLAVLMWYRTTQRRLPRPSRRAVTITPQWLDQNVFIHRPEVVGAAWDGDIGKHEVNALLSAMLLEGKIEELPDLTLRLLVKHEALSGYERQLARKLFFDDLVIDSETFRKRYARSGVDLASCLGPVNAAAIDLLGPSDTKRAVVLACAGLLGTWLAMFLIMRFTDDEPAEILAFLLAGAFVPTVLLAWALRVKRIPWVSEIIIAAPMLTFAWLVGEVTNNVVTSSLFLAAALFLMWVGFKIGRREHGTQARQVMANLAEARRFFANVERDRGIIESQWIPYMKAFGLASTFNTTLDWFSRRIERPRTRTR